MPRQSSPEEGGNNSSGGGGDGDSLVPIPFPRAVSGEYGGPSPFNTPSQSQSPIERASSIEEGSTTASANASSPSLLPRGRFQSEVDGASSRRRPRPNSYDEFGSKPPRRSRFESMVNLGVASGEQASASDLMARDMTEGSVSRQTLVVREEGKSPTHFVSLSTNHSAGEADV